MLNNLKPNEKVFAVFLAFLLLVGLLENAPSLIVLMIIFAILYSRRQREQADEVDVLEQDIPQIARRQRPANVEQVHQHALEAVRRAGLDPNDIPVLPVDIGMITFHGNDDPVIHRTWPVEDDCDYIQPFLQLRVPVAASGKVRFEIYDDGNQPVFVHEDNYQLERGRNLIIPSARLPIHDEQRTDGRWEMRVIADNVPLATHTFTWAQSESAGFHRYIGEDGEMSSELRAVLAQSRLQEMSLDELLAHQDEEEQPRQRQRR